jgi:hypothetical protein
MVDSTFKKHGLAYQVAMEVGGWDVIKKYVELGLGITIIISIGITGGALTLGDSNSNVSGNQIIDNVATFSNGEGLSLYHADNTLVRGNDLRTNKGGIALSNASHNRLEANDTSESEGTGISLQALSLSNEIIDNTSSNNIGAGIYVGDEAAGGSGMLIEGNRTHNNGSYGIHVPKPSHIIKNNIANENDTWGIYAGDGSNGHFNIDSGGNRAQDNLGPIDAFTLLPLQCYNVFCDGSAPAPDPIPPDTLILQGPSDPSLSDIATFHFNGSDNVGSVTFQCRLDSTTLAGNFAACTSPHIYNALESPRSYTFTVRAVDISGNVDSTPASYAWTINLSPGAPETTITSGPDLTTVRTDATFEFSASKSNSTFECKLDTAPFAACTSPQTYPTLALGPHTFQVRATDSGGDTDATPATYTWTVGSAPVPAMEGLDTRDHTLQFCNAGHNAPILVRADGTVSRLDTGGLAAGIFDTATYVGGRIRLSAGDRLLFFTDGLAEAGIGALREFGDDRLVDAVVRHRDRGAAALVELLFAEVHAWAGPRLEDDATALALGVGA